MLGGGGLLILALLAIIGVAVGGSILALARPGVPVLPAVAVTPLLVAHAMLATALILLLAGAALYGEGYLAGVWSVVTLMPWFAAAGSVLVYVATEAASASMVERLVAVYFGVAAALLFLAVGAYLGRALSRRKRAQPRIYDQLRDRYYQLKARYDELCKDPPAEDAERRTQVATMLTEAGSRLAEVERGLIDRDNEEPALRWALATGYSNILRTLHRVEEMIVAAQHEYAVTGDALHDSLSLADSTLSSGAELRGHLLTAMHVVSPRSAVAFFAPAPGRSAPAPTAQPLATASTVTPAAADKTVLPSAAAAREVLREVRFALNDFRDDRVDGIIRARNRLLWTVVFVAIAAYFALALAMLYGVSSVAVGTASIFYLVGALAGLINRLRLESARSSAVEDYGLHLARLVAAPVLSGLAAIGGVYLLAKAPELAAAVTPSAGTSGATTITTVDIESVFDLGRNQAALLAAAVFGLVPAQLFSGLQRQADQFQLELERSAPGGGSTLGSGGDGS